MAFFTTQYGKCACVDDLQSRDACPAQPTVGTVSSGSAQALSSPRQVSLTAGLIQVALMLSENGAFRHMVPEVCAAVRATISYSLELPGAVSSGPRYQLESGDTCAVL